MSTENHLLAANWSALSGVANYNASNHTRIHNYTDDTVIAPMLFMGILSIIGCPGNALVFVVYMLKHKPSVHRTIIITLATYDFLLCAITLPFEIYDMSNRFNFREKWVCKIFRTLNYFLGFNSGCMILLMTVDRFMRVCKPLHMQMTVRSMRGSICFISVISAIASGPNMVIRGIHEVNLGNNHTGYDCTISDEFIYTTIPTIYNGVILILVVLVMVVLIILYSLIGHVVYKHYGFKKRFSETHDLNKRRGGKENLTVFACHSDSSFTGKNSYMYRSEKIVSRISTVTHYDPSSAMHDNIEKREKKSKDQRTFLDVKNLKITKIVISISVFHVLSYFPSLTENLLEGIFTFDTISRYVPMSVLFVIQKTFAVNHVVNAFIYGFHDNKFRNDCKVVMFQLLKKCYQNSLC